MLSLRSLVFGVGKTAISKREEAEEWLEAPPESAATPARPAGGRVLILEDGKDVVRG